MGFLKPHRVLAIGAHCDDIEIGCGGTLHRLSNSGLEVYGLIVTDTHFIRNGVVLRDKNTSRKEAQEAAQILGYKPIFGEVIHNCVIVNEELVHFMRNQIEALNIDTVFTHWDGDIHPDHRNVALATLSATRQLRNLLMYRSNFYKSSSNFVSNFSVDITVEFDIKMKALACYQSELKRRGDSYFDWVRCENQLEGIINEVDHAEGFYLVKGCL